MPMTAAKAMRELRTIRQKLDAVCEELVGADPSFLDTPAYHTLKDLCREESCYLTDEVGELVRYILPDAAGRADAQTEPYEHLVHRREMEQAKTWRETPWSYSG